MSEPVNLNKFRKQKQRTEQKARADENAIKFGRSKVEKQRDAARNDKATRHIDGHKKES